MILCLLLIYCNSIHDLIVTNNLNLKKSDVALDNARESIRQTENEQSLININKFNRPERLSQSSSLKKRSLHSNSGSESEHKQHVVFGISDLKILDSIDSLASSAVIQWVIYTSGFHKKGFATIYNYTPNSVNFLEFIKWDGKTYPLVFKSLVPRVSHTARFATVVIKSKHLIEIYVIGYYDQMHAGLELLSSSLRKMMTTAFKYKLFEKSLQVNTIGTYYMTQSEQTYIGSRSILLHMCIIDKLAHNHEGALISSQPQYYNFLFHEFHTSLVKGITEYLGIHQKYLLEQYETTPKTIAQMSGTDYEPSTLSESIYGSSKPYNLDHIWTPAPFKYPEINAKFIQEHEMTILDKKFQVVDRRTNREYFDVDLTSANLGDAKVMLDEMTFAWFNIYLMERIRSGKGVGHVATAEFGFELIRQPNAKIEQMSTIDKIDLNMMEAEDWDGESFPYVIPILTGGYKSGHWITAVAYRDGETIKVICFNFLNIVATTVINRLQRYFAFKFPGTVIEVTDFGMNNVQKDSIQCGVFTLAVMEIMTRMRLSTPDKLELLKSVTHRRILLLRELYYNDFVAYENINRPSKFIN